MIAALASGQAGNVAARQLLACGIGRGAIAHRVREHRLHFRHQGVYAVGHTAPPPLAREFAAFLACGDDSVISHASAGAIWGFLPPVLGDVHVTTVGRQIRAQSGIRVHTTKLLHPKDVLRRHNLPLTKPARTLLDLASQLALRDLERAIDEAMVKDLVDRAALGAVLARYPHLRGAARLGAIIQDDAPLSESEAERRFRDLVAKVRVIQPRGKVRILGYTVDFVWLDRRLIIEIDGYKYHRSRRKFESDRERDARLHAAGFTVVRFTWRQLRDEPAVVLFRLGQLLG